tara:strand:+ start:586 stop:816 length:231 start_codon:yes stop_codon:yes gene_type:complete
MSKLSNIYVKLSGIGDDIDEYIEECENDQIASDVAGKVKKSIEHALFELNCIVDDEGAGLYEPVEDFEDFQEEEDS